MSSAPRIGPIPGIDSMISACGWARKVALIVASRADGMIRYRDVTHITAPQGEALAGPFEEAGVRAG